MAQFSHLVQLEKQFRFKQFVDMSIPSATAKQNCFMQKYQRFNSDISAHGKLAFPTRHANYERESGSQIVDKDV